VLEAAARRVAAVARDVTVDEGEYRRLVIRMGIAPLVGRVTGDNSLCPSDSETTFLRLRDRNLLDISRDLSGKLEAAGVDHFFFKGVALIDRFYRLGDRGISDIDLFVRPSQRAVANGVLEDLGFVAAPDREQSGPAGMRTTIGYARWVASDPEGVQVDLHWAVDPLDRLLPRDRYPLATGFFERSEMHEGRRLPSVPDHVALVTHHLIRSDYLHVRGIVDLVLLLAGLDEIQFYEALGRCRDLGCGRASRALFASLLRDFSIPRLAVVPTIPGKMSRLLALNNWLGWWFRVEDAEHGAVTPRRIRIRIKSMGFRALPWLMRDAVLPPSSFLDWRWPGLSPAAQRVAHAKQLVSKVVA
jgi:hypothetical protein